MPTRREHGKAKVWMDACLAASACRKTMIQVFHDGRFVALINYGWEDAAYYRRWMGDEALEALLPMAGASLDIGSPNPVSRAGILGLFHALLNDRWKALFQSHYALVKATPPRFRA